MTKGQSVEAKKERLLEGRCPIHGLFMFQVDGWFSAPNGQSYTIVECPRRDCEREYKASEFGTAQVIQPDERKTWRYK